MHLMKSQKTRRPRRLLLPLSLLESPSVIPIGSLGSVLGRNFPARAHLQDRLDISMDRTFPESLRQLRSIHRLYSAR
jgi:hypothetical protein